uniref:Beta-lactamase domain-containing protein n=1 Tax=Caenorhabditis japonica TaxID=281687 RepID=A0A8R1EIE1_CAEJA
MSHVIAAQKPNWEPGTKSGYHAITYGWIVDQIVRRADPQHRSVGRFFKEEVADVHGIDFHIGLPPSEEHTVSRLSMPSTLHLFREIVHDPRVLIVLAVFNLRPPNSIVRKIAANPTWFKLEQDVNTFNNPTLHAMEQVAALGITKSRDLARLFSLVQQGKLFSKELLEKFRAPQVQGIDEVVMTPLPKGHGFLYERHPMSGVTNPYNSTRAFLASKKIKVLDWPACSPDLNLIESVWGILASSVYKTGKQYNSISEFKDAVKAEWSKIHPSYFENLSNSMPNRIFQVIQNNGGFTSY